MNTRASLGKAFRAPAFGGLKLPWLAAAELAVHCMLQATQPIPDRVTYEGAEFDSFSPLHWYDYEHGRPGIAMPNSTGGYHAIWRIDRGTLFLTGFSMARPELVQVVAEHPEGIKANWFSGVLRLRPARNGHTDPKSREFHLSLVDGEVRSSRWTEEGIFAGVMPDIRHAQPLSVFWDALVRSRDLHSWVRSLEPLAQRERIAAITSAQSDMFFSLQASSGPPEPDARTVAIYLDMLVLPEYLTYALKRIDEGRTDRAPDTIEPSSLLTPANKSSQATAASRLDIDRSR